MTVEPIAYVLTAEERDRLDQAEGLVRSFCGWHIVGRLTETVRLRGTGSTVLALPSLYVTDVSAVTVDGEARAADDYDWSQAGVLTSLSGDWTGRVEVTFTHGYDMPPAEIVGVVQAIAQRATDNPGSKPREQTGPFGDTFSQSGFNQAPALVLLDGEKEALSHYRVLSVK